MEGQAGVADKVGEGGDPGHMAEGGLEPAETGAAAVEALAQWWDELITHLQPDLVSSEGVSTIDA